MKKFRIPEFFLKDLNLSVSLYLALQALNFLTIWISSKLIPAHDVVLIDKVPPFLSVLANFDGFHYMYIAARNYGAFEQAFFPLYPFSMGILSRFSGLDPLYSGLILSNLAFLASIYLTIKLFTVIFNRRIAIWILMFLLLFPTSFFFTSVYTESFFLLFLICSLYFYRRGNFLFSFISGYFLGLTRLSGLFSPVNFFYPKAGIKKMLLILGPILGFLTYGFYLLRNTGNFFDFITVQTSFGANRSTSLVTLPQVYYRYIKIFLSHPWSFTHYVALFEFCVFTIVFAVLLVQLYNLLKNRKQKNFQFLLDLNLFSILNIFIPTLTGTLSSIPRYALISLSFFVFLGLVKQNPLKYILLAAFLALHIIFLSLFSRGYFIS
jgi:hypothetical protein